MRWRNQLHRPAVRRHPLFAGRFSGRRAEVCPYGFIHFSLQTQEKQMKIASLIARYLLALIFLVFGMNHYLNFIPMGPIPAGIAGQFFGALIASHYLYVVAFLEVVPAILLLINRYVPLALVVLGPIIVNICLTQILMAPSTILVGAVVAILWCLTAWRVRSVFLPFLQQRVAE
jgi:putative oxidoreductase